ncbi:hypothetical protein Acr_21g0003990 [Actinidia rufa]|uniref:Uncharacterized protein n=1 Tax=Actinidia rufa TaxID=165716 RepID=A0A7J0GG48_9ERIC|nr:hypothetical protein Acr_21g0003990 [Actinidia rufa]
MNDGREIKDRHLRWSSNIKRSSTRQDLGIILAAAQKTVRPAAGAVSGKRLSDGQFARAGAMLAEVKLAKRARSWLVSVAVNCAWLFVLPFHILKRGSHPFRFGGWLFASRHNDGRFISFGQGRFSFKARMRLPTSYSCDLIDGDHFSSVIWVLHFGCEELVPSSWAYGYHPRGKMATLDVNAFLMRALVLDKQSVLSVRKYCRAIARSTGRGQIHHEVGATLIPVDHIHSLGNTPRRSSSTARSLLGVLQLGYSA